MSTLIATSVVNAAEPQPELVVATAAAVGTDLPESAVAGTTYEIDINLDRITDTTLRVDVGTETLVLKRRLERRNALGAITWLGYVQGQSQSSDVVLTVLRGSLAGKLRAGSTLYEFATTRAGVNVVYEVDLEKVKPSSDGNYDADLSEHGDPATDLIPVPVAAAPMGSQPGGSAIQVDIMAVYSAAACDSRGRDPQGGCTALEAAIIAAIDAGNLAMSASGVNAQLSLVHLAEVSYTETNSMPQTLSDLRYSSDANMAAIRNLRDQHDADLVTLISNDSGLCGYASQPTSFGVGSDSTGFSVVKESCVHFALMHEVGHNFGSSHNRGDASTFALAGQIVTPNAFGFRDCGTDPYGTIMSYGTNCPGIVGIQHFSNPAVNAADGRPTGAATENNVEAMNYSAPFLAAYRPIPPNVSPTAVPDTATTNPGVMVEVSPLSNDSDNGPLALVNLTGIAAGFVVNIIPGAIVQITPPANFTGVEVINYSIRDLENEMVWSTITITVEPVQQNQAPVANPDTASTQSGVMVEVNVLGNDTDDVAVVEVTGVSGVPTGWSVVPTQTNTIQITPPASFTGVQPIGYTIRDAESLTDSSTISVTVTAPPVQNQPPVANPDGAATQSGVTTVVDVLSNDSDDVGIVEVTGVSGVPGGWSVFVTQSNNVQITPPAGFTGTQAIGYTIRDAGFLTATSTISVTVTAPPVQNQPPVANPDTASTQSGVATVVNVLSNDTDDVGIAEVTGVSGVPSGWSAVVTQSNTVQITPPVGYTGTQVIGYTIRDTGSLIDSSTISVTVTAPPVQNQPPVANPDTATTVSGVAVVVDVLANDTDDTGIFGVTGFSHPQGWTMIPTPNNRVEITPPAGFTGVQVLSYVISDLDSQGDTGTITVTVNAPVQNSAPVALNDQVTSPAGQMIHVDVLANDMDADGDALMIQNVTAVGTAFDWHIAVVQGGQFLEFTPPAGYTGTRVFNYTIVEVGSGGLTDSGQISFDVTAGSGSGGNNGGGSGTPTDRAARADGLSHVFNSPKTVVLTWDDRANDEDFYQVLRDGAVIATLSADSERYVDRNRPLGAVHDYRIRAMNALGGYTSRAYLVTIGVPTLTANVLPLNAARSRAILDWSGVSGSRVKLFRNNQLVETLVNDRRHILREAVGTAGTYKVCNQAETWCSRPLRIQY